MSAGVVCEDVQIISDVSLIVLIWIPDMFRVSCLALANKAEISQKS